jgi:hypothetical protein
MWTDHGHWVGDSIPSWADYARRPKLVARCGGPGLCAECSKFKKDSSYEELVKDDVTLIEQLARDIISMATAVWEEDTRVQYLKMEDFLESDTRVDRACRTLGIMPADIMNADWI